VGNSQRRRRTHRHRDFVNGIAPTCAGHRRSLGVTSKIRRILEHRALCSSSEPVQFCWPAAASVPVTHGEKLPFHHVFGRVAPHGMGLALGSVGFGVLATFITLDFAHRTGTARPSR